MEGATLAQLLEAAGDLTAMGILVLAFYTSYKGVWVWSSQLVQVRADLERQLAEAKAERNEWKEVAWRTSHLADRAVAKVEPRP